METTSVFKKIFQTVISVLLYLFLAVCLIALILTVTSKKNADGSSEILGYRLLVVTSDSMAECELTDVSEYDIKSIPIRSMVFVETVPTDTAQAEEWYAALAVGDVLTFRYVYTNQVTITHRITAITEKESGGYIIELAGDNKNSDSEQMTQVIDTSDTDSTNYVIGKVVGQNYPLGFLVSLLKEPVGLVLIVIVPCFIVILFEVMRIVGVVSADKKQRAQEEQAKKDSEIEELRRRLAALEQEAKPAEEESSTEEPLTEDRSCPLHEEVNEETPKEVLEETTEDAREADTV
ncbi:MAG: hypothetical protein IJW55_01570 [Clostridia bacterium]|nr:hypothetical protein [Clostridia bacterium]